MVEDDEEEVDDDEDDDEGDELYLREYDVFRLGLAMLELGFTIGLGNRDVFQLAERMFSCFRFWYLAWKNLKIVEFIYFNKK